MYFAIMSAEYRHPSLAKADPPCSAVCLQWLSSNDAGFSYQLLDAR